MKKSLFFSAIALMLMASCNEKKADGLSKEAETDSLAAEVQAESAEIESDKYNLKAIAKVIEGAESVMNFSEGRASVINKEGKLGVIDKKGKVIIPFEYDYSVFTYSDGIMCCHKNKEDTWYYFDHDGKQLFETHDGGPSQFSDGYACKYCSDDGKYYYIDKTGKPAFGGKKWEWADTFSDGMALVYEGNGWGFINTEGELVIPCKYSSRAEENPEGFHDGLALVVTDPARERVSFIDKTGKKAFEREFLTACSFSEGLASIFDEEQDRWGYIDKTGKTVITLDRGVAGRDFSEGLAMIHHWGTPIGYIDKTGKLVIQLEENLYRDAHPFHDGRARVWRGDHEGYIDRTGKEVIPCEYIAYEDFHEGIVKIQKGDKQGYIDLEGNSTLNY